MNMTADRVAMVAGASMPWMRMPGQSWLGAAAMFIAMWAVMMIAMMTPSLVPTLWRNRHRLAIAAGYFFVWILVGAAVYPIGVVVAFATMRWPALAHAVPTAGGVVILLAGFLQLTAWKARQLQACRSSECAKNPWQHGLRLGLRCTLCCSGLMSTVVRISIAPDMIGMHMHVGQPRAGRPSTCREALPEATLGRRVAGNEIATLVAALETAPQVSVNPHVDSELVMNAIRRALARAGYALEDFDV